MAISKNKEVLPHALLLPFPAQGHINPFMEVAQLLSQNNVMVTFVNTEHNHNLLPNLKSTESIRFLTVSDGLPKEHGRHHDLINFGQALVANVPPRIEKIIEESISNEDGIPPISAIVSDGMLSFIQNVADKYDIPRISFWTTSACGFAGYSALPVLRDNGLIPAPAIIPEGKDHLEWMNNLVNCVPAMETLRGRDFPTFFRTTDASDFMLKWIENECANALNSDLIILNTWEDLEGPVLKQLNKDFDGKVLSIGPLMMSAENRAAKTSLWEEESSCLAWLDDQSSRSVIYVAFGSIALLSDEQFEEFTSGLENCGQPFLWVVRPDLMKGKSSAVFEGFAERCKDRACFVKWAPQRKVLEHPAVAGFVSHCGWNSTMESLCAGVPMLCWPYFAEQQTNRRFVSTVWNTGLELSEEIRGEEIVKGVKEIMECYENGKLNESNKMAMNTKRYRESALLSTQEGGTSRANVNQLLEKIRGAAAARLKE